MTQVLIKDRAFKLHFSLKAFRIYGEMLGITAVFKVWETGANALSFDGDIDFERLETLNKMILACASVDKENPVLTEEELEDHFMTRTSEYIALLGEVGAGFMNAIPPNEVKKLVALGTKVKNRQGKKPAKS